MNAIKPLSPHIPPESMSASERCNEIAYLLAVGLFRCRTIPHASPPESGLRLGFHAEPSVHGVSATREKR